MRRRWLIGSAAMAVVVTAGGALGWMSHEVTRLEAAEALGRREAAREQAANLALWRMDLALARLVAEEGMRSADEYRRTDLPAHPNPQVLLHFDLDPAGSPFSPEVAVGVVPANLLTQLSARLGRSALGSAVETQVAARSQALIKAALPGRQAVDQRLRNALAQQNAAVAPSPAEALDGAAEALTPVWSGDALLLVRRARLEGRAHLLGSWLDWPSVREGLLASIRDLLPEARLEPVVEAGARPPYLLASLPVRLVPGEPSEMPSASRSARSGVTVAWVALALAALALLAGVGGALRLGERKATFASAVTHELRTPLTTFRVYAEMLEGGMVPPGETAAYFRALRSEAERLTHLVENVLAWSRLERGRFRGACGEVGLDEVLERELPRVAEWAQRTGMFLEVDRDDALGLLVRADPTAIGQILFNLVDNACKYARGGPDQRVELTIRGDERWVRLAVRDHGPGLPRRWPAARPFRAFAKGAAAAALSAPGIGLGLSLSRRLARGMGGDLVLLRSGPGGAEFELRLPRAS